eukprot:gene13301-14674_t
MVMCELGVASWELRLESYELQLFYKLQVASWSLKHRVASYALQVESVSWCKCGHCKTEKLEGPAECKCCQEIAGCTTALFDVEVVEEYGKVPECVTLHPGFNTVCLSKWTLRLASEKYRTQLNARYVRMTSELK